MNQVIGLFLVSYILSHPDVVPQWLSSLEVSRVGVPQNGPSICDHAGLRHKRDVGDAMMPRHHMEDVPMMPGAHGHMMDDDTMMHGGPGPMMRGPHRPMMHGGHMVDIAMMPGNMFPDDKACMDSCHVTK